MTFAKPELGDGQVTKRTYSNGDRVLCRVSSVLTHDQYRNTVKAVQRYMRAEVRVIVVNCCHYRLAWEQKSGQIKTLISLEDIKSDAMELGVANLDCSVVPLQADDKLHVGVIIPNYVQSEQHQERILRWWREWAGRDVEIILHKS